MWGVVLGLLLLVVAAGCGGDDDNGKPQIGSATLQQTGVDWRKLTPIQKKTVAAYCLPPQAVDVSPTRVAAAINRLYAGGSGAGPVIGTACTQAVKGLRVGARASNKEPSTRVAPASKALVEFCPDDPQFVQPDAVKRLTNQLAVAYEQSPNPAKDRKDVETAISKLEAGCGPSARLQKALQMPARKTMPTPGSRKLMGNGPKELGNLVISRDSDLRWSRGGKSAYFSVSEEQGRLSFLSEASRGYRGLPAGTYRDVWVDTDGPWTIVITPTNPSTSGI